MGRRLFGGFVCLIAHVRQKFERRSEASPGLLPELVGLTLAKAGHEGCSGASPRLPRMGPGQ